MVFRCRLCWSTTTWCWRGCRGWLRPPLPEAAESRFDLDEVDEADGEDCSVVLSGVQIQSVDGAPVVIKGPFTRTKNGLGFILGDLFTNPSGHPDC
jgi:hypothetical protein